MLTSFLHFHFSGSRPALHSLDDEGPALHNLDDAGRVLRRSAAIRGRRGFTLIELLVVLAVITIMTAVLLLQQKKFDSSTLLRSLAYSVSLTVRQAQVFGTSVRQFGVGASSFTYSYGVYFDTDGSRYFLFADANNNKQHNAGEDVQQFKIGSGYSITKFCGILNATDQSCTSGSLGAGSTITSLVIYFKRPNPDAQFSTDISGQSYCGAYVQITGPGGNTRSIRVTSTGQILITPVDAAVVGC